MGGDCLLDGFIVVKIHAFVFHAPPEPFNEYIVKRSTTTIHAYRYLGASEHACKCIIRLGLTT